MKTLLLPNYFKKIGLLIFVVASLPSFITGVVDGFTMQKYSFLAKEYIHLLDIIGICGIALYAFAKDKVFDELLQRLKLEAVKITFLVTIAIVSLVYILLPDYRIHPSYLINLQMIFFIGIYSYKKANIIAAIEPKQTI